MRDVQRRLRTLEDASVVQPGTFCDCGELVAEINGYGAAKSSLAAHFVVGADGTTVPLRSTWDGYHFEPTGPSLLAQFCRESGGNLPALHISARGAFDAAQ